MRTLRFVVLAICGAVLMCAFSSPVKADERDKLTIFTFSAPVELPGVTLPAGTYAFKLADTLSPSDVVQVWNKDQTHLYATFMAIPDYMPEYSEKTVIRFSETSAGGPPAIKEWFYPGSQYGYAFVYPKERAVQLAKDANQPVPSMPQNLAQNTTQATKDTSDSNVTAMKDSKIEAEEPNGKEVEVAEAFVIVAPAQQPDQSAVHKVNTEYTTTASARELPKTASNLPALWMAGMCLLMVGMLMGLIPKRTA